MWSYGNSYPITAKLKQLQVIKKLRVQYAELKEGDKSEKDGTFDCSSIKEVSKYYSGQLEHEEGGWEKHVFICPPCMKKIEGIAFDDSVAHQTNREAQEKPLGSCATYLKTWE